MKSKVKFAKPEKFNKTKSKRELDKLFSLAVRSCGRCELQGMYFIHCGGNLQCMHIIGRGNLYLRWNRSNAICGCAGHHVYYTYHPEAWRELLIKMFPHKYPLLLESRNEKITFNETYYKEKLVELDPLYRAFKEDAIIK